MGKTKYGAWDESEAPDPNHKHNWFYTALGDQYVCVECGLRENSIMHRLVERIGL